MAKSNKEKWEIGHGVVSHSDETKLLIEECANDLVQKKRFLDKNEIYEFLHAVDLFCNQAIWIVAHTSYAQNVYFDGRELKKEDFKESPEGHMGGSLNMVPAYLGYMAANYLTNFTRSWMMGQGHCVIAIDAINLLTNNLYDEQAQRYQFTEAGISNLCRDFYSYHVGKDGAPDAPLGSHVNAHTGGGIIEGGYLGFAELLYGHAALKGEKLITFLSDGAFEEQRGSDWFPRWWRAEDCGITIPIMIANGRRIDQRTTMQQQGGIEWFKSHLKIHSFDPVTIDGKDPAAFIGAILKAEKYLQQKIDGGISHYPVKMPYIIAESIKGYGFPGAGTNNAHNLPLGENPYFDLNARQKFNEGIKKIWIDHQEISELRNKYFPIENKFREKEKIHALANRNIRLENVPVVTPFSLGEKISPMAAIDLAFVDIALQNPHLRIRLGNPDELRSNRMNKTLDLLKHRVTAPEAGISESIHGAVITALNEEAVVCAALGNKGGINMAVTYEAFAVKMLGALRQEIIFATNQTHINKEPRWLSVPIIVTSHTWENGKNEHSHQDPTFIEALLGENSYQCRAIFPADANSAQIAINSIYQTQGKIFGMVVPKNKIETVLNSDQALSLMQDGLVIFKDSPAPQFILTAIGAYQLEECMIAFQMLEKKGVQGRLVYIQEPGKLRLPRSLNELRYVLDDRVIENFYPANINKRVFLLHTRPEPIIGVLRRIDTGFANAKFLGYINKGGTLSTKGMLYTNFCSHLHVIKEISHLLSIPLNLLLDNKYIQMLENKGDPNELYGIK